METRDKIIEITFRLLLKKGYDGVSISDIQQATGMSRGLLYHYFGSKEALFLEAAKKQTLTFFQIDSDIVSSYTVDKMADYIVGMYRKFTDDILCGASILDYDFFFYRVLQENEEMVRVYDKLRNEELNGWKKAVENSFRKGELREGLNFDQIARQFTYITDGVWLGAVSDTTKSDLLASLQMALSTTCTLVKKPAGRWPFFKK